LTVRRSALPPDHYTGAIYLALEGQTARETVPLDVSVRTGPWWPLVALFMGLLLGRVFKYMQERGGPQAEALDAVNELEVRLRDAHPDDRTIVAPMLERVRQSVYREKLETVEAALQAIEARLDALGELRRIEGSLAGKEDLPEVQAVLAQVSKAREHLRQQQDAEAATLLAEIKQALLALARAPGMMGEAGEPDEELAASAERAAGAGARIEQAARAPTLAEKVSPADRVKDWLVVLSGLSDQIRAEATLWLVRPLLYFALILGLLAMGISSLYVDKGAAFGANPFGDYLGLVLWGLSADVASRSLSNLQGGGGG
jgi:Skp family chaperone for outer membrane proteins